MNKLVFLFYSMVIIYITGCKCSSQPAKTDDVKQTLPPVETKAPNSNKKPAFTGQTRISGVKTKTAYKVDKLATGIGNPWAIAPLPDGRFLITDKKGYMQIFDSKGNMLKKITGLPPVEASGQGGLLDVALDPDFTKNRFIYWAFSEKQSTGNLTAVAKGKLSNDETTVQDVKIIFRASPSLKSSLHFGSRLVFDKSGYLFVSSGERSNLDGRKQAQWLNSGLGKIFRITKDGAAAPGNPFTNTPNAMPEIYAYGIRNCQSLAFHPVSGQLWEAEFGPRGGDELNIIQPGKNYGWPVITYGIEYSGSTIGEGITQKAGMEQPVYYWDPVLSPSGMTFYTGNAIPEWKNNLFIGGLSSTHIARLVIKGNRVVGEERLIENQRERIRDVAEYNGALYAVSDGGVLFRIGK